MKSVWVHLLVAAAMSVPLAAADAVAAGASKCSSIEVRKEWRSLSRKEKKAWIDAVNCLTRTPRSGKLNPPVNTSDYSPFDAIAPVSTEATYYDELVYVHMNLNPIIHNTGLFLPWHRLYALEWTNALRSKCGYKGVAPYWAWENDAANFENSSIWDPDPVVGLGGFGDPNDDNIVKTGGLNVSFIYPTKHKLRRNYRPYPFAGIPGFPDIEANTTFTPAEVQALLAQPTGNFTMFQYYMEKFGGMHGAMHGVTGGDLAGLCPGGTSNTTDCPFDGAPTFSANEPMFHLHHGNIDRLWWLWQEKNLINKFSYHGGSVQNIFVLDQYPNGMPPWLNKTSLIPGAGMYKSISIASVLDTRNPPLCYVYDG